MSSTPFGDLIKAAAEAKYVVIPDGDYAIVVRDCTATKTSTSKDMLKLSTKVLMGPHKDATVLTNQTLSPENPAAVAIFLRFLAAFGLDEDFLAALPPRADGGPDMDAVARALKGRVAIATVGHHQWNDEDRNDISKFKKPNAEQEAAIKEAVGDLGGDSAFAPPAASSDPFAASAAAPAGAGAKDPF